MIVFATISGLWRVQASGAELEQIRERKDDEGVALRLPHVLPGGQAILYTVRRRIAWSSTSFSALDRLEWLVGPRTWGNPDVIDRQSGLTMSLAPGTRLGAYEITG